MPVGRGERPQVRLAERRRPGRARAALVVLISLALVAAACGGDDDPEAGAGNDTTSEIGASGAPDAAGDSEATLTFAGGRNPVTFDPHISTAGGVWVEYQTPLFDGLTDLDAEGMVIPQLATSWEFIEGEDGWTLRFELREGVVFHDGAPFDAEAAKANLERGKTVELSTVAAILEPIEEIEVVDELTIDLHLANLDVTLPAAMAHQAGRMISPASFDDPGMRDAPVAAGMYRLTEFQPDSVIRLERFDDYWNEEALEGAPQEIVIRIMPDATSRIAALRTGQVDIAGIAPNQVEEAEGAGFTVESNAGLTYIVIYANRTRSELGDVRVRKAMNFAINRQAIVDTLLHGQGVPVVQPFPPGYFAHNPDYPASFYEYNPDEARRLLAEAGLEDGFTFEFISFPLAPYQSIAEAVQAQWAEVGINAQIRMIETSAAGDIFFGREEGDVMLSGWGGRPDPAMTLGYQFVPEGFGNPGGHSTERMQQLYEESLRTVDPEERVEVLHAAVAEVVEQAFQFPIAAGRSLYAMSDRVFDFTSRPEGPIDLRTLKVRPES